MDSQCQVEFRKILEGQRQTLIQKIQQKKRELRAEKTKRTFHRSDDSSDTVSDGIAESVQDEIVVALIQSMSDELHKIDNALWRLERGGYGSCSECGEMIAERRLQLLPYAARCKKCQEIHEAAAEQNERRQRDEFNLFDDSDSNSQS